MIGIYRNDFIELLQKSTNKPVSTEKGNDIVCWCPHCINKATKPHLYISKVVPIFRCFRAGCGYKGTVDKLIKDLTGFGQFEKFVDKTLVEENNSFISTQKRQKEEKVKYTLPDVNNDMFQAKVLFLKDRMKQPGLNVCNIPNLILDVKSFFYINNIQINNTKFERFFDYLCTNFVGFLTEFHSTLILRNIDTKSDFRYYKIKLFDTNFLDYYRIPGGDIRSNKVVVSEGTFDVLAEHYYNTTELLDDCAFYAAAASADYSALLKSFTIYEDLYKMDVHVLSDIDVNKSYYDRLKKQDHHIIDRLTVYYNKNGKDFGTIPAYPVKYVI